MEAQAGAAYMGEAFSPDFLAVADLILLVQGQRLPAHTTILGQQAPVLLGLCAAGRCAGCGGARQGLWQGEVHAEAAATVVPTVQGGAGRGAGGARRRADRAGHALLRL